MEATCNIQLDRSDLDLRLSQGEITALAYLLALLARVRRALPALAPLGDAAVLSLLDGLPAEVLAANPFERVA